MLPCPAQFPGLQAGRFHIPLGTRRDWEPGRKEPDAAARACFVVIARNPLAVAEALLPVE